MRKVGIVFALVLGAVAGFAQVINTVGIVRTASAPVHTPSGQGAHVAIDTLSGDWYEWDRSVLSWRAAGFRVQQTNTFGVPNYTPGKQRSRFAINAGDSLYFYQAGTWALLNATTDVSGFVTAQTLTDTAAAIRGDIVPDTVTYLVQDSILVYYTNGSEVGRDTIKIQSGGGGVGTIKGTGTTNFGAVWASSDSLRIGAIRDSAGLVGIGRAPLASTATVIRGLGTSSVTTAFRVEDSAGNDLFRVRDEGNVFMRGFLAIANNTNVAIGPTSTGSTYNKAGTDLLFASTNSSNANYTFTIFSGNRTNTSGTSGLFNSSSNASFGPSSGSGAFRGLNIGPTINQTGTASGSVTGIDYNPTVTSVLGPHYGLLIRSGRSGFGTATPNASAIVDMTSTTQGFLPPRMTTTQRNAISTPADGLIIFCTDCTATDGSTGVSQTYSSSAWRNHY